MNDERELESIREEHEVPAVMGGRIKRGGRLGAITGAEDEWLLVRMDGDLFPEAVSPTWGITYLAGHAEGAEEDNS